ncbi:hypothetical protein ACH35V_22400 [Actinomadura sp. 1N219]|uniref:hypothetical protein n=1 Tax=Actinomadura sp. 1N219 TaxID=3375152 RepID=UPI0037BD4DFE
MSSPERTMAEVDAGALPGRAAALLGEDFRLALVAAHQDPDALRARLRIDPRRIGPTAPNCTSASTRPTPSCPAWPGSALQPRHRPRRAVQRRRHSILNTQFGGVREQLLRLNAQVTHTGCCAAACDSAAPSCA